MRRRTFILGLALPLLAGCAGVQTRLPPGFSDGVDGPYTLSAGDRLRVIVFGQDGLSNSYAVDGGGRISMPLIGLVPAGGLTTVQLERAIEGRLRNGFLREPRVSVEVEQYRPFYVLGEVTTSGQFPFVNGMTAQTAVAIAGGFTPRAERDSVVISRQVRGQLLSATVPITYPVRPGDTVQVRERWF